jgi:D-alanyl-D-alanine dipeptidase
VAERDGKLVAHLGDRETPVTAKDFVRDRDGRPLSLALMGRWFVRFAVGTEEGVTFRVKPLHPIPDLRQSALAATPPAERGKRAPELVELVTLDSTIRLDIRYATDNNFMGAAMYSEARAFMQRPAAEAVVRAHRKLKAMGFGLLIHDAYRPWYVTKMFWDATTGADHEFVADPASGSRHNRGAAVDLTLYTLADGKPVRMPGGYDEFSHRSYPTYPGGSTLERWRRELLRSVMESEGFTVNASEWWHFDLKGWTEWPIGNIPFEQVGRRP